MKRCIEILASFISFVAVLSSTVSCSKEFEFDFGFKDLCFYHPHTAPVKVNVDWSKFSHIEQPTGMTVYVWPQSDDEEISKFVTHSIDAVQLDLEAGYYHAFVFNQSDSEYATLEFHNLEDYRKAEARVKQSKSSWYSTRNPETKLGTEPEWLAIDCLENIEVTEEMVEIAEQEFLIGKSKAKQTKSSRSIVKSVNEVGVLTPTSIIKNVDIYIHFENIGSLSSALGAIDDMAEGCYISSGNTTDGHIGHTIESWHLFSQEQDTENPDIRNGVIKASLSTFGVPAGHSGKPGENRFHLRLLLADNETILQEDFYVGDQLADINSYDGSRLDGNGDPVWPEIHIYWPEPLPSVNEEVGSDGAFDVGVGGWDDEIVTVLPLR